MTFEVHKCIDIHRNHKYLTGSTVKSAYMQSYLFSQSYHKCFLLEANLSNLVHIFCFGESMKLGSHNLFWLRPN